MWHALGGLIEGAFYLQLFNAFLPNVIALADIGGQSALVLSRYADAGDDGPRRTPEFILAEKYALQDGMLAMVYGPCSHELHLAIIALFIAYFDKTLALKRCQNPWQQNQATERGDVHEHQRWCKLL